MVRATFDVVKARTIGLYTLLITCACNAQSLEPQVIAACGGSGGAGGVQLAWTVGEVMTETYSSGTSRLTQGFHQAPVVRVRMDLSALLEGPWNSALGRMDDGLRSAGLVPLAEPYTALGYVHVGGRGEVTTSPVLATTGADAIIDWVFVELRSSSDPSVVLATRSVLVQSDGDVVDIDGSSPVVFDAAPAEYHVAVHHRNHLGVMTASAVPLGASPLSLDLTDGSTATYGTDAQKLSGTTRLAWAGDVVNDGLMKYTNTDKDRDPMLIAIGGVVPTATTSGYAVEDVNMDGVVKYTGEDNDRDLILINIGGVIPTQTRSEQMP